MILKGILPNELKSCLEECQKLYDDNLSFNRFDESYAHKKNTKGLKAVDMSGEVIIGKDKDKTILVNVDHDMHPNPFIECQEYHCIPIANVYDLSVYEHGSWFAGRKGLKSPILVLDFLKNNRDVHAISFTLRVKDSKKPGHRLGAPQYTMTGGSGKQRRMVSACWHVHRDVMKTIFEMNPEANLRTTLAHYENKESFHELFPGTGYTNWGSEMFPAYAEELCECD